jgi:hypothetical protein
MDYIIYSVKNDNLEVLLEENLLNSSDEIFDLDNYKGNQIFLILTMCN